MEKRPENELPPRPKHKPSLESTVQAIDWILAQPEVQAMIAAKEKRGAA